MMSVSRVTLAQGMSYYSKDNYYTKDGAVGNSSWYGTAASKAGLSGKIHDKTFAMLLSGQLPSGKKIRLKKSETKVKKDRAGTDLTLSAPKSVSLVALLGEDSALISAHEEAVQATLDYVESRYLATRVGSQSERKFEYTENSIVAQFHHDTSRAMDPNLHTHNIVFNGTEAKAGWRSVYDDVFRNRSKDLGVIYQNELASRALRLGYDIVRNGNGTFDLKGYSREQILHFSKRHAEIQAEEFSTKKQERAAVLKTREAKRYELDRGLLWARHRKEGENIGLSHPVPEPGRGSFEPRAAGDFVDIAINHLSQRNVAFTKEEVETSAMSFSLGLFKTSEIHDAVKAKVGRELIRAQTKAIDSGVDEMKNLLEKAQEGGYQNAMYSKLLDLKNSALKPISDELNILAIRERDSGSRPPLLEFEEGVLGSGHLLHLSNVDKASLGRFKVVSDLQSKYQSDKIRGISGNGPSLKEFNYCIQGLRSQDNYFEFLKKDYPPSQGEVWVIDSVDKIKNSYLCQILERAEKGSARVVFLGGDERIEAIAKFKSFGRLDQKKMEEVVKTEISNFNLTSTQEEFTTKRAKSVESEILEFVENGKDKFNSIVTESDVGEFVERASNKVFTESDFMLTDGQKEALALTLTNGDRYHRWRGVAGSGKTASMDILKHPFERSGYKVRGFAPTGDAALNLAKDANLKDFSTVARLLTSKTIKGRAAGKELWIVDEAGMLSNEDKLALAKKASIENARVLLVGDERQNSSVGAGNPFYLTKRTDIDTALLEKSVRPTSDYMKEVFSHAIKLRAKETIETVDRHGKLIEVKDDERRIDAVAREFVASGPNTLVICKTNQEKGNLTQKIRLEKIRNGDLGKDEMTFVGLSSVNKTEDQLKFSFHFEKDQVLIPYQNKGRLSRGQKYTVLEVREKSLVLENPYGKPVTVKPEDLRVQVFDKNEMSVRSGDQLRWTKIHNDQYGQKRNTGAIVTVKKVDLDDNSIVIDNGKGGNYRMTPEHMQYFSFGYAQTVDSVQGKTTQKTILLADSLYDKEAVNVAATRAKEELVVYTADKESLYPQIDHDGRNLTSHEVSEQFDYDKSIVNLKDKEEIKREEDDGFGFDLI